MSRQEVIGNEEIYLCSRHPTTGAVLREGRFRLAEGTRVQTTLQGLNPPVIAIGEEGRDTEPLASSVAFEDNRGGIGVYHHDAQEHANRVWWATADIRHRPQTTLMKKKSDRSAPTGVGSRQPRAGGVFNDQVWVAWDGVAYRYTESGGWGSAERTFTGGATPAGNPLEWEGGWLWFLGASGIDVYNGTTWWNVASSSVGGVVYANTLYLVSAGGAVKKVTAATATAKIAAGTLAASDLTAVVTVSDTCSGLVLFTTADAEADVVPYVVGRRTLYQLDPATGAAQPALQLPPWRTAMRATSTAMDGALYAAQGMSVVKWDGQTAEPKAGLDADDGVPVERRGSITALLDGGQSLFALVDVTEATGTSLLDIYGTGASEDGVLGGLAGASWLASREGEGWSVRAESDADGQPPTMLFLSTAEDTYRLWFAWDAKAYTIDLEPGLFNPLDDPTGQYEASGRIDYPLVDFGYHERPKIGLTVVVRTRRCTTAGEKVTPWIQFDEDGTWHALYNADGTHGIGTDGRHTFLLRPNPTLTDGAYADDPAATGKQFERAQLRLDLTRRTVGIDGDVSAYTPAVVFAAIHAIKAPTALLGWQMTLDLTGTKGKSAWQQRALLLDLVADNEAGLLHFAYLADADATTPGTADVRAVKVTGLGGWDSTGLGRDYLGRATLTLSEARTNG